MKKIISLILIILILTAAVPGQAEEESKSVYCREADKLFSLGLMLGTGTGFELDRVPQRVEAAVMLVRLLGRESEALMGNYSHPFTDVPEWADPYVGLLYFEDLTKGIGADQFGSYIEVDAKTYLTFLLRTLGYSDDTNDFSWENAVEDAFNIGLINSRELSILTEEEFSRGHMAAMSYNALNTVMKDSKNTLVSELITSGAVDSNVAVTENFELTVTPEHSFLPYLTDGEYMPYLVGADVDTAEILLRKSGIDSIEYVYEIDELIPRDSIIAQNYPAYIESSEVETCILTVSRGASMTYHIELMEICQNKGWDSEIVPYIIGSAKYLIKNTVLSKYEVYKRLEENLHDVTILNKEDSAALGFAALYDGSSKNMYINRHVLDYDLILHELSHALSNNIYSGKIGFHVIGDNTRMITEAFVESIAAKAMGEDTGSLNTFRAGGEEITFASPSYFSDGPGNYTLGVFSPLFVLVGENTVEKMYFRDISDYSAEALKFNEKYGERKWETLWSLADSFIGSAVFLSESDRMAKTVVLTEYLDGIIDCLYVDLNNSGNNDSSLRLLLFKTREIKKSYPLAYNNYREKIELLEKDIISRLSDTVNIIAVASNGRWIADSYSDNSPEYVYNSLTIEGNAAAIGYMAVESDEVYNGVVGVLYKEPGLPIEDAYEIAEFEELPLGGEYIILIPVKQQPEDGYILMRDLVNDFDRYLADFNNFSDYAVARLLKTEGISFRYDFDYYDNAAPAMNGRIIGQFPEAGTVVIPGKTTIRIFMIRERRW